MSESAVKWEKSRLRKNRFGARVGGKKVLLFLDPVRHEWLLTEDGKRVAGSVHLGGEAILREIAEQHYTHGLPWRAALAAAEVVFVAAAAKKIASL